MAISDPVDKFYICSYKPNLSSARKDTLRGFLGMPGPVDGSVFDIVDQAEIAPGRLGTRASAGEAGKAGIFTQKRIGLNREFSLEVVLYDVEPGRPLSPPRRQFPLDMGCIAQF